MNFSMRRSLPLKCFTIFSKQYRAMLVDVDCNLWHRDLPSLCFEGGSSPFSVLECDDMSNTIALVTPSSTLKEAEIGLAALKEYNGPISMKTTVGVHPYHVKDEDLPSIEQFIAEASALVARDCSADTNHHISAIGECGLDASDGFPSIEEQIPWFQSQISMAERLQMPLFVHERLAFNATMGLLEPATVPIIVHCFTGTKKECCRYVERGYSLSISGYIFRQEAQQVRDCLEQATIPLDRLMIETDAPYMGFPGCRESYLAKNVEFVAALNAKKRKRLNSSQYPNPPSALRLVFNKVLHHINVGRALRGESLLSEAELVEITTQNADRFFGFGLKTMLPSSSLNR